MELEIVGHTCRCGGKYLGQRKMKMSVGLENRNCADLLCAGRATKTMMKKRVDIRRRWHRSRDEREYDANDLGMARLFKYRRYLCITSKE